MLLQAILSAADFEFALAQLIPARIALDDSDPDRYLLVDRVLSVEMTEAGLRLQVAARMQWDVIGIKVPLSLPQLTVRLTPEIGQRDGHDVLDFVAQIEDADVSALPELIETSVISHINKALKQDYARLSWDFMDTLDFKFKLPDRLTPKRTLRWFATAGTHQPSTQTLVLGATFSVEVNVVSAPRAESEAYGDDFNGTPV